MINKVLCFLGIHQWRYLRNGPRMPCSRCRYITCIRCGKEKH